jgi:hypothetical protein
MKALLTSILALCLAANVHGQTISLSGTSETEQAAKLELIRILNERMNKLTVAQLNARIIVSRGVSNYYKVDEIVKMNDNIYAYRSKYVGVAQKLEAGNPGFSAHQGNGFTYKYIVQLNEAVSKSKAITDQLGMILKSGSPLMLPAMPTFNISQSSSSSPASDAGAAMVALNNHYGVDDADDYNALSPEKRAEYDAKFKDLSMKMYGELQAENAQNNQKLLGILGNVIGAAFGAPMAGTLIMSVISSAANGNGVAGLVGSIVDSFQIPVDYYDSNTLKLTDAERLKIIDELHVRISELYQQVAALGASLSTETKVRYNELSGPRNEQIMHGIKK